jgi:hypothetical protein
LKKLSEQNKSSERIKSSRRKELKPMESNIKDTEIQNMSEIATIVNTFLEPGKTFQSLRQKPYFIAGTLILCLLTFVFSISFASKIGEEGYKRFFIQQNEKNPQYLALEPEKKQEILDSQVRTTRTINYLSPIIVIFYLSIGGLIAWVASKLMGGDMSYLQSFCLWLYSSLPPSIIFTLANLIVLYFKPQSDISLIDQQKGLVTANLSFLIGKDSPVLATLIGSFDLFVLWGWILFAIGLQRMAKLSSTFAWLISAFLFLISLSLKVVGVLLSQ